MFDVKEKNSIVITIVLFVLIKADLLFAMTMTCAIPSYSSNKKNFTEYIKLVEPKTIISFDTSQNISRFNSPGCKKFESISRWENGFMIKCGSDNTDSISLTVESLTLRFEKTYSKNNQKNLQLVGFCITTEK